MRTGRLIHVIKVQSSSETLNARGTPVTTWADKATLRAQIVQQGTEEFIRGYGASDETVIVFRTRYVDGIENADRVAFDGRHFNIKEVTPLGRRKGLELRCTAQGED